MSRAIWILVIVAHAGLSLVLSRQLGLMIGLLAYSVVTFAITCLAGWLLQGSAVGTVTWRNRLAGLLLPWPVIVGGGSLRAMLVKNQLASILFGIAVVACDQIRTGTIVAGIGVDAVAEPASWWDGAVFYLTMMCWAILLGAWLWMLRSFLTHHSVPLTALREKRGIWLPLVLPPLAVAASVALVLSGNPWAGLLSVGLPIVVMLMPVLPMVAVVLFHYITGKPIRWN